MAGLQIEVPPAVEPILLADAKNYLKVSFTDDDTLIQSMIVAAREHVEAFTGRSLVNKGYLQTLDSFPYFVDTVVSSLAYPPSYYSLPRYSTTLWNYSQMIKLLVSPLVSVARIDYLGTDAQYHSLVPLSPAATIWYPATEYDAGEVVLDGNGNLQQAQNEGTSDNQPPNTLGTAVSGSPTSNVSWSTAVGGITTEATGLVWQNIGPAPFNPLAPGGVTSNTFFVDTVNEPPRLFPGPAGSFWPPVMYVPNAVQIHFTAGYGAAGGTSPNFTPPSPQTPDGIWNKCLMAMLQLIGNWYESRESATPFNMREIPQHTETLLWSARVYDLAPTRG